MPVITADLSILPTPRGLRQVRDQVIDEIAVVESRMTEAEARLALARGAADAAGQASLAGTLEWLRQRLLVLRRDLATLDAELAARAARGAGR